MNIRDAIAAARTNLQGATPLMLFVNLGIFATHGNRLTPEIARERLEWYEKVARDRNETVLAEETRRFKEEVFQLLEKESGND